MDQENSPSLLSIVHRLVNEYNPASPISSKLKEIQRLRNQTLSKPSVEFISSPPVDDRPSPFFRLPLELREAIYGWVQGGPHIKIAVPFSSNPQPTFAGNVLLHVNKQIFNEYTNLILSTSQIVLDFMSHDPPVHEAAILRTAHKLTIRDKIPAVCGPTGYNRNGGEAELPAHPGAHLAPWVHALIRNPAITHLEVVITQSVLFLCRKHEEGEECDHVKMFRRATKQLHKVVVSGSVKVVWDVHGWTIGMECNKMKRAWINKLERKIMKGVPYASGEDEVEDEAEEGKILDIDVHTWEALSGSNLLKY